MAIQIVTSSGGTAAVNSIVIPQSDLAGEGLQASELTNNATGLARGIWAFLKAVQMESFTNILGLAKTAVGFTAVAASPGVNNWSYGLTVQKYINFKSGDNGMIPLPTTGTNNGVGLVAINDIFPNASKVDNGDAISGAALLFPTSDLAAYDDTIVHANVDIATGEDNRHILSAMYQFLADSLALRTTSVTSAFTARSNGVLSDLAIPSAYIAASNPTSGLSADDVGKNLVGLMTQTFSITLQTNTNLTNDTIDVNVVTA